MPFYVLWNRHVGSDFGDLKKKGMPFYMLWSRHFFRTTPAPFLLKSLRLRLYGSDYTALTYLYQFSKCVSSLVAKALFRAVQVTHVKLWDSSTSAPAKKARLRGSSQKSSAPALVKKARPQLL